MNVTVPLAGADTPVTVSNVGAAGLQITAIAVEGANAADFTVLKTKCSGAALKPNASCAITIRFKPGATGPRTGQLVIADNAVDGPLRIDLAGSGA